MYNQRRRAETGDSDGRVHGRVALHTSQNLAAAEGRDAALGMESTTVSTPGHAAITDQAASYPCNTAGSMPRPCIATAVPTSETRLGGMTKDNTYMKQHECNGWESEDLALCGHKHS